MSKIKVAILGTGNIGTDLMIKLERSTFLQLVAVIGIDETSSGFLMAKKRGYKCFSNGIDEFIEDQLFNEVKILFDATSAQAHIYHSKKLIDTDKYILDLTPAAIGPYVIPTVNLSDHLEERNLNLVTCGGQATIPVIYAVSKVCKVIYAEIVSTISSNSAGIGTRENIDEFTQTTAKAIEEIGDAKTGKAIILLNPAEPPILMKNTIYIEVKEGAMNKNEITESIENMVKSIQAYVPGYQMMSKPIIEKNIITVLLEVKGAGDFLPKYAGNLDIMTAAALKTAEEIAAQKLNARG